jgi:hypothetical protein
MAGTTTKSRITTMRGSDLQQLQIEYNKLVDDLAALLAASNGTGNVTVVTPTRGTTVTVAVPASVISIDGVRTLLAAETAKVRVARHDPHGDVGTDRARAGRGGDDVVRLCGGQLHDRVRHGSARDRGAAGHHGEQGAGRVRDRPRHDAGLGRRDGRAGRRHGRHARDDDQLLPGRGPVRHHAVHGGEDRQPGRDGAVVSEPLVQARPTDIRPEWVEPAPPDWDARLREISPIVEKTSHLRFRWQSSTEQWELYECTPAALLSDDRVAQLSQHWSELPPSQQMGRRRFVSEYQFFMFRTHRVEARRFWILQGSQYITGGTPYAFTDRERRVLEASNLTAEPVPPGLLPNIPFDERVVRAIAARDRLRRLGGNLDALARESRPDAVRAADEETERQYRAAFLDWHKTANAPSVEFMKWYGHQKESRHTLPPAPAGLANVLTDWRDQYVETGAILTPHRP